MITAYVMKGLIYIRWNVAKNVLIENILFKAICKQAKDSDLKIEGALSGLR